MTRTQTPRLEIRNLSVTIDTDEGQAGILERMHLRLMPGSIHGVVGESGCGKSTLMRAILGILPAGGRATDGNVLLDGRDLLTLPPGVLRREIRGARIGFIPQDPYQAFNPVFRVGTQLLETTRAKRGKAGGRGDDARAGIIALLKALQLPDPERALDRYPHQFSGGQRQRLLIAAALASSPAVLLADEPTTALDVTTQAQILKLLRGLAHARGLSMLFVTHDFGVVAQLCDTVTVMYAGQMVESGPVARVLAAPLHPYTRMLLACHPDRNAALSGIAGAVASPLHPPAGCRFHPRCPRADSKCANAIPPTRRRAGCQEVCCVLYDEQERV